MIKFNHMNYRVRENMIDLDYINYRIREEEIDFNYRLKLLDIGFFITIVNGVPEKTPVSRYGLQEKILKDALRNLNKIVQLRMVQIKTKHCE